MKLSTILATTSIALASLTAPVQAQHSSEVVPKKAIEANRQQMVFQVERAKMRLAEGNLNGNDLNLLAQITINLSNSYKKECMNGSFNHSRCREIVNSMNGAYLLVEGGSGLWNRNIRE